MLLVIEGYIFLLLIVMCVGAPRALARLLVRVEHGGSRFGAHRGRAVLTILLLALGARLAVLPIEHVPVPGIHDEFGFLLSGDTFAHGRLTNPTHPMWIHFESMTIIQQPTYSSAFYPAQGIFLAAGQVLFGHPFWGVWLSTGLMCAAVCWALQGWMPPSWAFLGGLLAIMRLSTFSYWTNSYWGGSVAALGGALVLGALARIKRRRRIRDALIMGIGFAILANSRPYEGLFYSLPILVALSIWTFSKSAPGRLISRTTVLPLVATLALTFVFMGYFFWRTTGNPLLPPYVVNASTYMQEPVFIWQSLRPAPTYHHAVMEKFYGGFHVQLFQEVRHNPVTNLLRRIATLWLFFVGPALTVPLLILGAIFLYRMSLQEFSAKTRFLLILLLISCVALLLPAYFNPHYAAPMVAAMYAVIMQAMRRVRIWGRRTKSRGLFVVRAVVLTCVLCFIVSTIALAAGIPRRNLFIYDPEGQNAPRAELISRLKQQGGKHLIVVRYAPQHDLHNEWVYNDADIDRSRVVWAREINPAEDARLIAYFKDRQAWLLQPDGSNPKLAPYPAAAASNESSPRLASEPQSGTR